MLTVQKNLDAKLFKNFNPKIGVKFLAGTVKCGNESLVRTSNIMT